MLSVFDFHCDLLSYLEGQAGATPFDPQSRCSIPQLKKGGVKNQVLAIFTDTNPGSVTSGLAQAALFSELRFSMLQEGIHVFSAFENASGFCSEVEPLSQGLKRFDQLESKLGPITYVSLTWNNENRFGGLSGLKTDGKELVRFLSSKNIPVDLSHAPDALAEDIFSFTSGPVLASHSNARAVLDHPRNLPDAYIKEIIARKGVIGLNFVRKFVGDFRAQIDHFLSLGAQHSLVLGADFFYGDSATSILRKPPEGWYFPEYQDASCYPKFIETFHLNEGVAFNNAQRMVTR